MQKFVFIHLPKTAGSSFDDALRRALGEQAVSPPFAASHLTEAQAATLDLYKVVSGHISLTDVERYFPDRTIITILRDPIDRCVSCYNYFAKVAPPADESMPDVIAAQNHDIDEFFALDRQVTYRSIFNRQTRQLGDHALNLAADHGAALDRAMRVLDRAAWIGLQDSIASDLVELMTRLPEFASIDMRPLNVTPGRRGVETLSAETLDNVRSLNAYDIRLYDYAASMRAPVRGQLRRDTEKTMSLLK